MEITFKIIVGILVLLAISDLIVGVSNDAVNFLNSAIGSKAAPLKLILLIAALGVLFGATFSSGMMEVARKGIFYPGEYHFKEIMIIFLAVMFTDIILLDLFNTFALPTSTTVSIVFELLGAAVGVAIIKITANNENISELSKYINSGNALAIISGILVSVVVAFSVGAAVMWISRLLFSFDYTKSIKYFGGIFGGLAITAITYFILIKGLKGSVYADKIVSSLSLSDWTHFLAKQNFDGFKTLIKSLNLFDKGSELANWGVALKEYNHENFKVGLAQFQAWSSNNFGEGISIPLTFSHYVKYYTLQILGISFVSCAVLIQLLNLLFRINILKIIVIIGTFALAMAFAGNDLVNFIGVPLAGIESYKEFAAHGINPNDFPMGALAGPVQTNIMYLLIAALVMIITLWLSKKAKSVVKTTLNLSDQDAVNERFESSVLARSLVRFFVNINKTISYVVPGSMQTAIAKRFDPTHFTTKVKPKTGVSFDLIRASVNLVVAAILIALGTSLKLPLSTTYVTFMVAMGTSLADGAWDRESAVYRITGVVTVIGGWFFTAISAFSIALIISLIIAKIWVFGIVIMGIVALFIIYRTHILHKKRSDKEQKIEKDSVKNESYSIYEHCSTNITSLLIATTKSYKDTIDGLLSEKRKKLKNALSSSKQLNDEAKNNKKRVAGIFKELNEDAFELGHYYSEVVDYAREAMHSLNFIVQPVFKHIDNNHKPLTSSQAEAIKSLVPDVTSYLELIIKHITESDFKVADKTIHECMLITEKILKIRKKQLKHIKVEPGSTRTNILFLDLLNETKNLLLNFNNMYKAFRDFSEQNNKSGIKTILK
jgi:phosphate/sulfate permease